LFGGGGCRSIEDVDEEYYDEYRRANNISPDHSVKNPILNGGGVGSPPGRYSGDFERIQRFNSVQIGQKPSMDLRMNGMNTSGGGERKWSSGSSNNIPPYPKKNEKKKQTWSPEPVSSTRNKIKASSSLEFGSP
jgi:hypothetical protein